MPEEFEEEIAKSIARLREAGFESDHIQAAVICYRSFAEDLLAEISSHGVDAALGPLEPVYSTEYSGGAAIAKEAIGWNRRILAHEGDPVPHGWMVVTGSGR